MHLGRNNPLPSHPAGQLFGQSYYSAVMFVSSNLKARLVDGTHQQDAYGADNSIKVSKNGVGTTFLYRLPFSTQSYYMMRPVENVHIYLWILKDLSWAQDWYYPSLIFGGLALVWCVVLFLEAIRLRSMYEVYMNVGVTLWLVANFTWMAGKFIGIVSIVCIVFKSDHCINVCIHNA